MQKVLKFIFSGGMAALSKLLVFLLLFSFLHVWYLLSSALAFAFSIIVGFYLQKYVTFENNSGAGTKKQAVIFTAVSCLNLLVNITLMYLFVDIFLFNEILSQIVTIGILASWNFFVYQKFVFSSDRLTL